MADQDTDMAIRNALVPAINDLQNSIDWQSKVINHHEESIEALEEQVAHLTAAVEYAAGRMPQETRDTTEDTTEEPDAHAAPAQSDTRYPDDDPDVGYPGQAASYLLSNLPEPFDLTGMHIHLEGETLVLDTSGERFEPTDEWQEWTSQYFGKGKLGSIEWQDVGDHEEVWVPQAFKLPLAEFDEVFDDG